MTVLVTGGAGFIGSHMALELLDAGEDVLVLDNLSTGFRWAVPEGAKFIEGDVGDQSLVRGLLQDNDIDAILHFAGSIVVPESVADPLGYYLNNTCKSRSLIACAVETKIPNFIFSSSAAVYGIPKINPVTEDATLEPISPYGSSKLMTETMLRDTAKAHPLRFVALRYFNVAGADPKGRSGQSSAQATHLIKVASETALGMRPRLEVFGTDYETPDGTCIRDYIHVQDLAQAHLLGLEATQAGDERTGPPDGPCTPLLFNLGNGSGFSNREVLSMAERVTGRSIRRRVGPRRPGDPAILIASAERARKELGWRPSHDSLEEMIGSAWEWRLANPNGYA
jgi:UDP-glucose 4-epimerase